MADCSFRDVFGSTSDRGCGTAHKTPQVGGQVHHISALGAAEEGDRFGHGIEIPHLHQGVPDPEHAGSKGVQVGTAATHPDGESQFQGQFRSQGLVETELRQASQDLRLKVRSIWFENLY